MRSEIRDEYESGGGDELGTSERPGKMASLRSSSALTYNFFAPWYGRDLRPLATALNTHVRDCTLQFERRFPHGLSSEPPNIDVALDNQRNPLAVECKFTEPYGVRRRGYPPKYFVGGRKRWAELGLLRCKALAEAIGSELEFMRLDAGQLVKHILGITFATNHTPRLVYLWFDAGCQEVREHRGELERSRRRLDSTVDFGECSYQEAFGKLRQKPEPVPGYVDYLAALLLQPIRIAPRNGAPTISRMSLGRAPETGHA